MSDAKHSTRRRELRKWLPRAEAVIAVLVVGVFCGMAGLAVLYVTVHEDLQTANKARDALASQVEQLGASPVAGSPGSRGEPGKSVVGPSGPPGPSGASGEPAPTITPSPGRVGPSGASGAPGKDSTVAGPSGPPGADSTVAGSTGPAGPQGVAGRDGQDGKNGSPPAGWTFTYKGTTYTCSPATGFDESNPQYDCTSDEPSSPSLPVDPGASLLVGCAAFARRRDGRGRGVRAPGRHRKAGRDGGAHR